MKLTLSVLFAICGASQAFTPVTTSATGRDTTSLMTHKSAPWSTAAAATFAGWVLASQVAVASVGQSSGRSTGFAHF
jgi:hypothetical protein